MYEYTQNQNQLAQFANKEDFNSWIYLFHEHVIIPNEHRRRTSHGGVEITIGEIWGQFRSSDKEKYCLDTLSRKLADNFFTRSTRNRMDLNKRCELRGK
jgi:hypothetical protein